MPLTVIIVNFNSFELLAKCLRHLSLQTVLPGRVFVLDNASTEGFGKIKDLSGRVTVFKMTDNIGFAAGNNFALAECTTPLVALLNPDAFPEPDWIEKLLLAAEKYPEYSMFGSRLVSAQNPKLLDGDGDRYHVSGAAWREGHGRLFQKEATPWEVFSPCAAAAMYRTEALREAGGFDEDFFCYLEDVDLGFRMRLLGHRCLQVPSAVVHHLGSATSGGQRGDFAVYHGHRNMVWTFFKNMPATLFWILLPLHVMVNLISVVIGFHRWQGKIMIRAKIAALAEIRTAWQKRSRIQNQRKASAREILRVLDKRIFRFK
ncbi:MAG: glycosyltransferase family 2 protein [Candidatus Pacebacteria bacterium]|nr:glycosyltransferase family 2 protein [Candidatus Paceibacterota bacterium]